MIRYALRCSNDHRFDSWFGSSGDFERLQRGGMVSCAVCGSSEVEKDLMAPRLGTPSLPDEAPTLSRPASPAEQALRQLRQRIEATSEDVGSEFAAEARRIHDGISARRSIIGEARPADAKALIEDGIPVAPLPWRKGKTN
jgi:hypothetical protein